MESFTKSNEEMTHKTASTESVRLANELYTSAKTLQDTNLITASRSPQVTFVPSDIEDALIENKPDNVGVFAAEEFHTGAYIYIAHYC